MAIKETLHCVFGIVILIPFALNSVADNTLDPIIINTVAKHYENPTLEQYSECTRIRDICINRCGFTDKKCQDKCQICPILIDQDILVQGINDTLYRLPITTSKVNQTNIIRLTNEIRNIIRTSLGNITAHSQNNITIYHKVSRTGGKFGLGYNEKGPCCHLIEPQRCRSSLNGPICTHRRQQTCGSHCIARVMRSKRVVTCSETDSDNCTQTIEYLPLRRRPGCQYTSKWPFISCKTGSSSLISNRKTICVRCFQIPYLSIIRGQVPRSCLSCFGRSSYRKPSFSYPQDHYNGYVLNQPMPSYPSYQPYSFQPAPISPPALPFPQYQPSIAYDNNFINNLANDANDISLSSLGLENDDFKIEEQKCINEDGTIVENCTEDDSPLHLNVETNLKDDNGDQSFSYDDYEVDDEEISRGLAQRRRRQD